MTALASPRSFERGVGYVEEGRVGPLRVTAGHVGANVQGAETYAVELSAGDGGLRFACSCPIGLDGAFCKHCVAVALTWLHDRGSPMPTLDDARRHLETLPSESLVELLVEHARHDQGLARKLLLMASRPEDGTSSDLAPVRAVIDRAFAQPGFVPYREVSGYVRGIDETIDVLEGLLAEGRGGEVVDLAEHALGAAEHALEYVDDSDGEMGSVIERLEELHIQACRLAAPDPVALADRLFRRELEGQWDVFDRAVVRYAEILGDAGLARYRELAEERWASVPALAPGEDSEQRWTTRFRITRIMEALAELSGSLAEQIAVRERDLASGYRFLQIAELCRSHGDHDAALGWAEWGMSAFADEPDPRLRAFLVDEYRRRGRPTDALEHSLAAFSARPSLETYRGLATDAQALGEWTERREAALTLLRDREPEPGIGARHRPLRGHGFSELVRVCMWEGDLDAAWEAANEGGCTSDLWLGLADRRRTEHPNDALSVYRHHIESIIARKDKRAYTEAVRLIDETARELFAECDRLEGFNIYVEEIRTRHKAKRNLMKLLGELTPAAGP